MEQYTTLGKWIMDMNKLIILSGYFNITVEEIKFQEKNLYFRTLSEGELCKQSRELGYFGRLTRTSPDQSTHIKDHPKHEPIAKFLMQIQNGTIHIIILCIEERKDP